MILEIGAVLLACIIGLPLSIMMWIDVIEKLNTNGIVLKRKDRRMKWVGRWERFKYLFHKHKLVTVRDVWGKGTNRVTFCKDCGAVTDQLFQAHSHNITNMTLREFIGGEIDNNTMIFIGGGSRFADNYLCGGYGGITTKSFYHYRSPDSQDISIDDWEFTNYLKYLDRYVATVERSMLIRDDQKKYPKVIVTLREESSDDSNTSH